MKENKLAINDLEIRLKREKLKPKLTVKFNPLLATSAESLTPSYSVNDLKWGFNFSMPVFFRKEKAQIQYSEIKQSQINLELQDITNQIFNSVTNSISQIEILEEQIQIQELQVDGYLALLNGEREKFLFGESSVFLLNKRQEKYIESQLKLIDLKNKIQKERAYYLYYTNGLLN